jgi:hypothetical protein
MLSDRPYRAALTLDEARAEIRRGAGVQFDPALARLFLDRCPTSGATVAPPPASGAAPPDGLGVDARRADRSAADD